MEALIIISIVICFFVVKAYHGISESVAYTKVSNEMNNIKEANLRALNKKLGVE